MLKQRVSSLGDEDIRIIMYDRSTEDMGSLDSTGGVDRGDADSIGSEGGGSKCEGSIWGAAVFGIGDADTLRREEE